MEVAVSEEAQTAITELSPPPSPTPLSLPLSTPSPPPDGDIGTLHLEGIAAMDSFAQEQPHEDDDAIFSGLRGDLSNYSNLSLEEKRSIVHKIWRHPEAAVKLLQSWTRRELLQLICAEMGEQRKYTGLTKPKMIERLLKIVSKKVFASPLSDTATPPEKSGSKRRKLLSSSRKPADGPPSEEGEEDGEGERSGSSRCPNLACQAPMDPEDPFCKRCSCCVCHRYDEDKDPTLWLVCGADEPPPQDGSAFCGLTCHLRCAVELERCGMSRNGSAPKLDVAFFCPSCGKENQLIGFLRKQLVKSRDARRVDLLCKRMFLSNELVRGSEKYPDIQKVVEAATTTIEREVGPLDNVSVKTARGLVKRLICGPDIPKLCALAVDAVDRALARLPDPPPPAVNGGAPANGAMINGGDVQANSPDGSQGLEEPAAVAAESPVPQPESRNPGDNPPVGKRKKKKKKTQNLNPKKRKTKKVNGAVMSDNDNTVVLDDDDDDDDKTNNENNNTTMNHENGSAPVPTEEAAGLKGEGPPKSESTAERRYEYCVKVIRWLECAGLMEKEFRVKFLTWFSLKATAQERRVVSAFIDVLIDEPASLVDQLLDAFKDSVCQPDDKPTTNNPKDRPCLSLWH